MAVSGAFSLGNCEKYDINTESPVLVDAKQMAWRALISSNIPFHVAVGDTPLASVELLYVPMGSRAPFVLAIPGGHALSILGAGVGAVWVCEVR